MRHLGISYNAARAATQADAGDAMAPRDREPPLRSAGGSASMTPISVASEVGASRGRGAPGKTPLCLPPSRPTLQETPVAVQLHRRRDPFPSWVMKSPPGRTTPRYGTRVESDGLACFHGVTGAGCVHCSVVVVQRESRGRAPRVMGEYDSRQHQERLAGVLPCDSSQVAQRYLSEFEYRFNRRFDLPDHPETCLRGAQDAADAERLLKLRLA